MISTVLGWGTASPHWSEVMKLLFWISLVVFFLIAPLLSTDTATGSAWINPDQANSPLQYSADQSGSLASAVDVGNTQIEGDVLNDLAPKSGAPLEQRHRQASATTSPLVMDGVHMPTVVAGMEVVMHLSQEREPEGLTFGLRIPEGTHIRMAGDTWLIERDVVPGGAPAIIAAMSTRATNAKGTAVTVTTEVYSPFCFRELNLRLRVKHPDVSRFRVAICLTYRAEE